MFSCGQIGCKVKLGGKIMSKTINLFVSHKGEDESKIDAFKKLMERKGYDFRDSSIRESEPNKANNKEYIKKQYLKPAIDWAGTVVVLIGNNTHKSDWVNWEIEYAQQCQKKIIGVYIQGEKDSELPEALKDYAESCVGWNAEKIDEVIRKDRVIWEDQNGNPIAPNASSHVSC